MTVFQAVMEAGHDPINPNLEEVALIRQDRRSKYACLPLNLQMVLVGKETEPFYFKPSVSNYVEGGTEVKVGGIIHPKFRIDEQGEILVRHYFPTSPV